MGDVGEKGALGRPGTRVSLLSDEIDNGASIRTHDAFFSRNV